MFHRLIHLNETRDPSFPTAAYETSTGNVYKFLEFLDFNSLYPFVFAESLPCGVGICFERDGDNFKLRSMHDSGKPASIGCLEWLEWKALRNPYPGTNIKHAANFGEVCITVADGSKHFVDGYQEVPMQDDEQPYKIAYEFKGCRYHRCAKCDTECILTDAEAEKDWLRTQAIRDEVDLLVEMSECEWNVLRKTAVYSTSLSKFIGQKKITEEDIISAVMKDEFFGILKVRLSTPEDVINKYESLGFPFIFCRKDITEDMLSEKMKSYAGMPVNI